MISVDKWCYCKWEVDVKSDVKIEIKMWYDYD